MKSTTEGIPKKINDQQTKRKIYNLRLLPKKMNQVTDSKKMACLEQLVLVRQLVRDVRSRKDGRQFHPYRLHLWVCVRVNAELLQLPIMLCILFLYRR